MYVSSVFSPVKTTLPTLLVRRIRQLSSSLYVWLVFPIEVRDGDYAAGIVRDVDGHRGRSSFIAIYGKLIDYRSDDFRDICYSSREDMLNSVSTATNLTM